MTGHSSGAVVLHPLIPMDDVGSVAHLRHKCKYTCTQITTQVLVQELGLCKYTCPQLRKYIYTQVSHVYSLSDTDG